MFRMNATWLNRTLSTSRALAQAWRKRFPTAIAVISALGKGDLRINNLNPFSLLTGRKILQIPSSGTKEIRLTRDLNGPVMRANLHSSKISSFEAENVVFEPQSEVLRQGHQFFRQSFTQSSKRKLDAENLYSASSLIIWNTARLSLTARKTREKLGVIPQGILLNGQAVNNWYHWLVNIGPKAFIATQLMNLSPDIPFLVSNSIKATRMEELLWLIVGEDRPVIFLDHKPHLVERAIVIETPVREVYRPKNTLSAINWRDLGDFHFDIMVQYRKFLKEKAKQNRYGQPPKMRNLLFLARDNVTRPYNHSEVESVLAGLGFESVHLEELPIIDQVLTMERARIVIGPTGAQWAGWLFSERAIGIILVPSFLSKSALFAKLGLPGKSELFEFLIETPSVAWAQYDTAVSSSIVDVSELKRLVEWLLGSSENLDRRGN